MTSIQGHGQKKHNVVYLLKSLQVLCPTRAEKHVQERNSSGEFTWQAGSTGTTDNAKSERCRQLLASVRMNLLPTFSLKPTPSSFHNLSQCVLGLHFIDSTPWNLKSIIRELTFYWKSLRHFSSFHFPLMGFFRLKLPLSSFGAMSFSLSVPVRLFIFHITTLLMMMVPDEVLKATLCVTFSKRIPGDLSSVDVFHLTFTGKKGNIDQSEEILSLV